MSTPQPIAAPPSQPAAPYVPAAASVPEITARAVVLGLVLSVLMGAANTYLGLRIGMTVSASIPAAVISMGILRGLLRRGTILENNIVQTMASTGESLAAGVIFTIPAIVMVGAWQDFRFWPTTCIVLIGGVLGIVFMVPMRRALIVDRPDLRYPEGVACAEVLIVGEEGGSGMRHVASGVGVGAVFAVLLRGVQVVIGTVERAWGAGRSVVYVGTDISAALLGVGYIVGLEISALITLGGVIGWLIAMPLLGGFDGSQPALDVAWDLWDRKVRYIGVGTMLVGGVHSILSVRRGLVASMRALRASGAGNDGTNVRTERNLPLLHLGVLFFLSVIGTLALYQYLTHSFGISAAATVAMILTSFLFVAVATYIAGLVGSSNSPVSGMTICALLITAGMLMALGIAADMAILATLGVAGVVCCATCTSGDIAQDLKTGLLVGATPARQQSMEILATVVTAFFFAPILTLLHHAYGIGTGAPGALQAPQAGLFASLSQGLFGQGDIQWPMVGIGAVIGVALLGVNAILGRTRTTFRAHVMPVAVGIYLPLGLDMPLLIGGLLRTFCSRRGGEASRDPGILFGSGLIAGEALMGIVIAIVIASGADLPLRLAESGPIAWLVDQGAAALLAFAVMAWMFVRVARTRT
jgi:putative OPT family oligopeptide transporter